MKVATWLLFPLLRLCLSRSEALPSASVRALLGEEQEENHENATGATAVVVGALATQERTATADLQTNRGGVDGGSLPIRILIMTLGRSGSTLIGQLFRQNKDIFYIFEPCRAAENGVMGNYGAIWREDCLALLYRLSRCEFTLQDSDRLSGNKSVMWSGSQALRRAKGSPSEEGGDASTKDAALALAHQELLGMCKKSRAVAMKTIRLLDGIHEPANDLAREMHVLHLVRDPRPVIRSQLLLWGIERYRGVVPNFQELERIEDAPKRQTEMRRGIARIVCQNYQKQIESRRYLDDKRYLRIRYEDFATLPHEVTQMIYNWSGLGTVPSRVTTWIDENTTLKGCEGEKGSGIRRGRDRGRSRLLSPANGGSPKVVAVPHSTGDPKERDKGTGSVAGAGAASTAVTAPSPLRKNLRQTAASPPRPEDDLKTLLPSVIHAHPSNTRTTAGLEPSHGLPIPGSSNIVATGGDTKAAGAAPKSEGASRRVLAGGGGSGGGGDTLCGNEKLAINLPYNTKRHSQSMVNLWRQQMPAQDIQAVWESCEEWGVMTELDYSP